MTQQQKSSQQLKTTEHRLRLTCNRCKIVAKSMQKYANIMQNREIWKQNGRGNDASNATLSLRWFWPFMGESWENIRKSMQIIENHSKNQANIALTKTQGAGAKRPLPWGAAEGNALLFSIVAWFLVWFSIMFQWFFCFFMILLVLSGVASWLFCFISLACPG